MHRRLLTLISAILVCGTASACSEKIEAGGACPLLCPQEQIALTDTTFSAVVLDSAVAGFPAIGQENYLLLANRGDTLDTRVIIRFDELPTTYTASGASSSSDISMVDSAMLVTRILVPGVKLENPITINVYNVDTVGVDTVAAGLLPLFRPDRLLGSATFDSTTLGDTLMLPISNSVLLQKIIAGGQLRVGLQLAGVSSAQLRILSSNIGGPARLRFRVSTDTAAVQPILVSPVSETPDAPFFLRTALADYVIVARSSAAPSPELLAAGGYPPRRTYMQFDIPKRLLDSTTVVRATLVLTQVSNPSSPGAADPLTVAIAPVLASSAVTDIGRALTFTSEINVDTARTTPASSGPVEFEIVQLVRSWTNTDPAQAPRTVALRIPATTEGEVAGLVLFYSSEGAVDVRPSLKITYVPLVHFDLP